MPQALRDFFAEAAGIWLSGGWGMIALAVNGLVMYSMGTVMLLKLFSKGLLSSPDRAWQTWQEDPARSRGRFGRVIAGAMACRGYEEIERFFASLRHAEVSPFERDLRVMKVSVSTAPLLGLLGTVTGMLATFRALATGGGGEKTMGMVAGGISEALVTTETGLILGLSGLIFQFVLTRQHEHYAKRLAHLETLCVQHSRRGNKSAAVENLKDAALCPATGT